MRLLKNPKESTAAVREQFSKLEDGASLLLASLRGRIAHGVCGAKSKGG